MPSVVPVYPLILVLACFVVRLRGSSWYLVRGIVLYRLVGRLSWSVVLLLFVVLVTSLLAVATAWPPWVPSGGQAPDPQEGGGDFSKRGEGLTETNPVPIFMRKVKKNVVFQRKTWETGRI